LRQDEVKSDGAISLSRSRPLLSDFSKTRFGTRSQLLVTSELFETCERSPPFPVLSRRYLRCKSFLVPSISSQFPECFANSVSGSRRVPLPVLLMALVYSLLWKISPPLIRKILAIDPKIIGFESYFFVEIVRELWKCDSPFKGWSAAIRSSHRLSRAVPEFRKARLIPEA
jgi:hypothetical protein